MVKMRGSRGRRYGKVWLLRPPTGRKPLRGYFDWILYKMRKEREKCQSEYQ